jgi:uncharacterized membrane protein YcaP (DUF421 family)
MKKEEIHLWDIKRILFGQAPPEFLLEVFIRSLIIYVAAILVLRWMGKRMNGQLTIIELAVMVMMGAIISVPMQIPDRGILQGLMVLFATLFFLRAINWLSYKSVRLEDTVQGRVILLIKDGVLQLKQMKKSKITNQEVFAELRSKNIFNLGKVKRMYLEACGEFSIYQEKDEKPGLPVFPPIDEKMYETYSHTSKGEKACCRCGYVQREEKPACLNCGHDQFTKAIL